MDYQFADKLVKECIRHYNSLPKKGKPISNKEWTLLSSIVMSLGEEFTVLSIATGTKCLGCKQMSSTGGLINDSHAEVLARRCFLRYLYDQIYKYKNTGSSEIIITCNENYQYEINPNIKFHFYSSHVPCGDASIIPKLTNLQRKRKSECNNLSANIKHRKLQVICSKNNVVKQKYRKDDTTRCENTEKGRENYCLKNISQEFPTSFNNEDEEKLTEHFTLSAHEAILQSPLDSIKDQDFSVDFENQLDHKSEDCEGICDSKSCVGEVLDIHRTGAKCLGSEDNRLPGLQHQTVGVVRTKPGRGDPTLSVSCSDKIARWIACGIQGALLSLLLSRPVLLDSVVIGGGSPFSVDVLHRAIISRSGTSHNPCILQSSVVFSHSRYSTGMTAKPCPSAILWSRTSQKMLEVCVEGRRQGTTKKSLDNGRLMACKLELLRTFLSVTGDKYQRLPYREIKESADHYKSLWKQIKANFGVWTAKPQHLEDFYL